MMMYYNQMLDRIGSILEKEDLPYEGAGDTRNEPARETSLAGSER